MDVGVAEEGSSQTAELRARLPFFRDFVGAFCRFFRQKVAGTRRIGSECDEENAREGRSESVSASVCIHGVARAYGILRADGSLLPYCVY